MKTKTLFLVPALSAGLGLILAGRATAQTFTTLHSFSAGTGSFLVFTNSDGAGPLAGLILSTNTLYGMAARGGSSGLGTVFKVNIDGTGFATVYDFTEGGDADIEDPVGGLILSGNTLYGTVAYGGSSRAGTVFAVNTDGTGFTTLQSSNGGMGIHPSGVILSGNALYGTTTFGGSPFCYGTVFAVNADGTAYTNLHCFTEGSDGAHPYAGVILSGNTVYGTAARGGSSNAGTVFAVNTDGAGFTNLHTFTAL